MDDVHAACAANGITLYMDGNVPCYEPKKVLPADVLAVLKTNRAAIVEWLTDCEAVFDRPMEAREYWGWRKAV